MNYQHFTPTEFSPRGIDGGGPVSDFVDLPSPSHSLNTGRFDSGPQNSCYVTHRPIDAVLDLTLDRSIKGPAEQNTLFGDVLIASVLFGRVNHRASLVRKVVDRFDQRGEGRRVATVRYDERSIG